MKKTEIINWTGWIIIVLAFAAAVVCVKSDWIFDSKNRHFPEEVADGVQADPGYTVSAFSYTAVGWNRANVNFSILEENLNIIESAPKPNNASARDYIELLPEHTFVTIKVVNNRTLARLLAQTVPEPNPNVIPCVINSTSPDDLVVTRVSCLARERYTYYVIGILEKVFCRDFCLFGDNLKIFSTTVVFGKNGQIIAKYRKFNMVEEPALDAPPSKENVTFQTEKNITIGLLTGHDLLFAFPAKSLFARGVKNFLLNGAWKNRLPFILATSAQLGWVQQQRGVNLMTANYMRPDLGYTGNGFYENGGYAIAIQQDSGGYERSVIDVDGQRDGQYMVSVTKPLTDIQMESENLSSWSSVSVPLSNELSTIEVCNGATFCCNLTYQTIGSAENANYQLVAFDGYRFDSMGNSLYREQTCGLVACSGADVSTCGTEKHDVLYTRNISFAVLKLYGSFSSPQVVPVTLAGGEDYFPLMGLVNFTCKLRDDWRYNVTSEYKISRPALVHSFALTSTDYSVAIAGVDGIQAAPLLIFMAIALLMMVEV